MKTTKSTSPLESKIMRMSWQRYATAVRGGGEAHLRNRIALLKGVRTAFQSTPRFADLDVETRAMIAGLPNALTKNQGYFGSMRGDGYFHNAVKSSPSGISAALDCVPLEGPVMRGDYEHFVKLFGPAMLYAPLRRARVRSYNKIQKQHLAVRIQEPTMLFPPMRYVPTRDAKYLELHSSDGTSRGVVFVDALAADAALRSGRAELDCGAIDGGFLPRGAFLVSRATARNAHELIAVTRNKDEILAKDLHPLVDERAAATEYVTQESNAVARLHDPAGADHYERLVDATVQPGISAGAAD